MITYPRVEIPKAVKLEVYRRAGGPNKVWCEGCEANLGSKRFEYDHQIEEWEQSIPPSQRQPITAADVKLLCVPCHDEKTGKKAGERAHVKRIVAKAAKAGKPKSRGFNRNPNMKQRFGGGVTDRRTGLPWGTKGDDDEAEQS